MALLGGAVERHLARAVARVRVQAQRDERLRRIQQQLANHVGKAKISWQPLTEHAVGYRTRAQVVLGRRWGRVVWGFWQAGTQDLVNVELCAAHAREVDHPYGMGLGLRYRAMLLADQGRIIRLVAEQDQRRRR